MVVDAAYGLHPYQYSEILNLKFWAKGLDFSFGFHSNYQRADEIKDLPISIDFQE